MQQSARFGSAAAIPRLPISTLAESKHSRPSIQEAFKSTSPRLESHAHSLLRPEQRVSVFAVVPVSGGYVHGIQMSACGFQVYRHIAERIDFKGFAVAIRQRDAVAEAIEGVGLNSPQ